MVVDNPFRALAIMPLDVEVSEAPASVEPMEDAVMMPVLPPPSLSLPSPAPILPLASSSRGPKRQKRQRMKGTKAPPLSLRQTG